MEKTDRAVLDLVDRQGRSALHYAAGIAANDNRDIYNWLIEYGADQNKADEVCFSTIPCSDEDVVKAILFFFDSSCTPRPTICPMPT